MGTTPRREASEARLASPRYYGSQAHAVLISFQWTLCVTGEIRRREEGGPHNAKLAILLHTERLEHYPCTGSIDLPFSHLVVDRGMVPFTERSALRTHGELIPEVPSPKQQDV